MLGVQRAQFGPVLWRGIGFSIAGVGAIMLLITTAAARENGARKIAELPRASQLPATTVAKPIPAWIEFCRRLPAECSIDFQGTSNNQADRRGLEHHPGSEQPRQCIDHTDHRLRAMGRSRPLGLADDRLWRLSDMQLLKRKLLAERGLPRRAMRMTVVINARSDGHAVLMLRTDRGDFILDNETDAILPSDRTAYVFANREGQDSTAWVSLGQTASPVATANR